MEVILYILLWFCLLCWFLLHHNLTRLEYRYLDSLVVIFILWPIKRESLRTVIPNHIHILKAYKYIYKHIKSEIQYGTSLKIRTGPSRCWARRRLWIRHVEGHGKKQLDSEHHHWSQCCHLQPESSKRSEAQDSEETGCGSRQSWKKTEEHNASYFSWGICMAIYTKPAITGPESVCKIKCYNQICRIFNSCSLTG